MAVREVLDVELDRLIEHSEWVAPIVVARRANGKIRLCVDFSTGLNEALEDDVYPIPNMESLMAKFSGNGVFSQLDFKRCLSPACVRR